MRLLMTQLIRFGIVGSAGLVIDLVVFNALRLTVLAPEIVHEGPVLAKVVSTALAILANWMGNRHWTFRKQHRERMLREGIEFAVVSVAGVMIGVGCLWVSHYVLGFTSAIADNISANVIGLGLGAVFRFALYKWWVFDPKRAAGTTAGRVAPSGAYRDRVPIGLAGFDPEKRSKPTAETAVGAGVAAEARNGLRSKLQRATRPTEGSRAAESAVVPAGRTPLRRVQAVAPVDDHPVHD